MSSIWWNVQESMVSIFLRKFIDYGIPHNGLIQHKKNLKITDLKVQDLPDGMYFENIIWNEACNCAHTILYKT